MLGANGLAVVVGVGAVGAKGCYQVRMKLLYGCRQELLVQKVKQVVAVVQELRLVQGDAGGVAGVPAELLVQKVKQVVAVVQELVAGARGKLV